MRRKSDFNIIRRIPIQIHTPEIRFPAYILTNSRARKSGNLWYTVWCNNNYFADSAKISILFNDKVRVIFDNRFCNTVFSPISGQKNTTIFSLKLIENKWDNSRFSFEIFFVKCLLIKREYCVQTFPSKKGTSQYNFK